MDQVPAATTPHAIQVSPSSDIIAGTKYQASEIATGARQANKARSQSDRMLLINHAAMTVAVQIGT